MASTAIDVGPSACAARSAAVEEVLSSAQQYDEAAIGALEEHVRQQVKDGSCDFAANKALVKLYQFTPKRCSLDVLALTFAKALMARPAGDLASLLYICPDYLAEGSPTLRRLNKCDALLTNSKFGEFWTAARITADDAADVALEKLVPGFESAVRRYIVEILSTTFVTVAIDFLAEALGIDAAAAKVLAADPPKGSPFVAAPAGSDYAAFAPNTDNQCRQHRAVQNVQLGSLLSLYNAKQPVF